MNNTIIIHLESILLQNGKFTAGFVIHEQEGDHKNVIQYNIKGQHVTKEDAYQIAEIHARDQVAQDYDSHYSVEFVRD